VPLTGTRRLKDVLDTVEAEKEASKSGVRVTLKRIGRVKIEPELIKDAGDDMQQAYNRLMVRSTIFVQL
jgi:hypothetical protein